MTVRPQDLEQWVLWRREQRGGREAKVPYSPRTHRRASSADPGTWGGLDEARSARAGHGYDGIGFVFSPEDPFCGVDLDGCVDPETGEVAAWALEVMGFLDSYAEYSPSGTGVHVLVRATLPGRGRKKGDHENGEIGMYDRGRFFTITGEHVPGTLRAIEARQEQTAKLYADTWPDKTTRPASVPITNGHPAHDLTDGQIIAKTERAANGHKFRMLYDGDWEGAGYPSQSEADAALCAMLAFYVGPDEGRISTLFAGSGLAGEKWDREDYRRRTIALALERAEFWKPPRKNGSDGSGLENVEDAEHARSLASASPRFARDLATLPEAVEFPLGAMPPECRRLVEEAADSLGCAPELVALPMLPALSSAVGASRVVEIKRGWEEGTTLFVAAVASPGAMKSPAAKVALSPVHVHQEELKARHAEEKEDHDREMREWEAERKLAAKRNEAAPEQPKAPAMKRSVASDTTVEALAGILEDNPRGLLIHRDELAGWLRSMDQYRAGGKGSDRQHWLSLWGNEPFIVDRKSRMGEPIILIHPVISLFGGIQPAMLGEMGGTMEDGLTDRFLFGYPAPRRIRYNEREISEEAEDGYARLYRGLSALGLANDENGAPKPMPLKLTPGAKRVFAEAVDALGDETLEPGFPARLEGVWSKMRGYLARLSLLLALCRCVREDVPEGVEEEDVRAACAMLGYFKAHARRVYDDVRAADPLDALAAELKSLVEDGGGEWTGTPTRLLGELKDRGVENLPADAANLSKRVRAISSRSAVLDVQRGWHGSERVLRITLKSPVGSVGGVGGAPDLADVTDATDATGGRSGSVRVNNRRLSAVVSASEECVHGCTDGGGCYLCDPRHPLRGAAGRERPHE